VDSDPSVRSNDSGCDARRLGRLFSRYQRPRVQRGTTLQPDIIQDHARRARLAQQQPVRPCGCGRRPDTECDENVASVLSAGAGAGAGAGCWHLTVLLLLTRPPCKRSEHFDHVVPRIGVAERRKRRGHWCTASAATPARLR